MMQLKSKQVTRQNRFYGIILVLSAILFNTSCNERETMNNVSKPIYDYENHFLLLKSDKLRECQDSVINFDDYSKDLILPLMNDIESDFKHLIALIQHPSYARDFSKQHKIDVDYIKQSYSIKKQGLQNALSIRNGEVSSEDIQMHTIDFYRRNCSLQNDSSSWMLNHDLLLSYNLQTKYMDDFSKAISNRFLESDKNLTSFDILPQKIIDRQDERFPQVNLFFKISPLYCNMVSAKLKSKLSNESDPLMKEEIMLWINIFSAAATEEATLLVY